MSHFSCTSRQNRDLFALGANTNLASFGAPECLYMAIMHGANDKTLLNSINSNPIASRTRFYNNLPLHHAFRQCASLCVIKALIESYRDTTWTRSTRGCIPLHEAIKYIKRDGSTPFIIRRTKLCVNVVEVLLHAFPGSMRIHRNSTLPLSLFIEERAYPDNDPHASSRRGLYFIYS